LYFVTTSISDRCVKITTELHLSTSGLRQEGTLYQLISNFERIAHDGTTFH
jgi:hypothetical protein